MEEELNTYIDERLNNSLKQFKKCKKWKTLYNNFNKYYNSLYENPLNINKNDLENLYGKFNDLSTEEKYIIYKIGFVDGITLRENLFKSSKNS